MSTSDKIQSIIEMLFTWGMEGIDEKDSLVLNIASIHHNPNEFEQVDLDQINYDWTRNN